jgi:hypothetical protein
MPAELLPLHLVMSLFSILNPAKDFALEVAVKLWFNKNATAK